MEINFSLQLETKAFSDTADEITPQNVIPERSIPVASSDRLQDMVDDIGEVRPKNARGFEETYVPQTNDVGRSKVVTNTYRKRNLAQWADEVDRRIATYNIEHETDTLNNAIKRVDKDGENWKQMYISGEQAITDATDVDTSMLLIEDLEYQAKLAAMNGATDEAKRLKNESYLMKWKLRRAGTKGGQFVNAFKKFNGTADGAILNAQRLMDETGQKWAKTHIRQNKVVEECSAKLENILKNMGDDSRKAANRITPPVKTHEQVVQEVENTLKKELAGIEGQFNNNDYETVAKFLEENVPDWQIEDEIRHKLEFGDWYTIDESIEPKQITNGKIGSALKKIVEEGNEQAAKPELSFEQLKTSIRNTIDEDYSSISKNFNDADIEYLANLVQNGAKTDELADMMRTRIANGSWDYSEDVIQKVNELFDEARYYDINSKERVDKETEAFWLLANANNPKSSLADKFDAWRYLAMLGNPKTHIRNMVGNTLFQGVTSVSNSIAAAIEGGTDAVSRKLTGKGIDRTKAILTHNDVNLIKACSDDAIGGNYRALQGNKYFENAKDSIAREREVFKSKGMRWLNKKNAQALDTEDFWAMRFKYQTSMAGYLKANGADETIFDAERQYKNLKKTSQTRLLSDAEKNAMDTLKKDVDLLEKARDYGVKQAEYSAFHEENEIVKHLSQFSHKMNSSEKASARFLGKIIEGIFPFKKTPANVLRSGIEYSPLGIANVISKAVKGESASEIIDAFSKTFTGTGLALLGASLYDNGALLSSDEDTRWQDNLEGKQNYSLRFGDKTFTIDFAAPSVMPLLLGAEVKKLINAHNRPQYDENGNLISGSEEPVPANEKFWNALEDAIQSTSRLASPLMETSMLSGLSDTLDSIAQANYGDALGNFVTSAATGYTTQGIPTVLGQFSRAIDNTRRSTYVEGTGATGQIQKQLQKQINKTPFSRFNEPYLDVYGREQNNGIVNTGNPLVDTLPNLLYQMVSAGYIQNINETDVDAEMRRLNELTNGNSKFADLETSVKDSQGNRLSQEQYTDYTRTKGESIIPNLQALFNSDVYKNATLDRQVKMKDDVLSLSKKIGKTAYDENYSLSGDDAEVKAYGDEQNIDNFINYEKARYNDLGLSTSQALELQSKSPEEQAKWMDVQNVVKDKGLTVTSDLVEKYDSMSPKDFDKYVDYTIESQKYDVDVSKAGQKAYEEKGNLDGYVNEYLPKIKELDMQNNETNVDLWIKGGTKALENKVNETTQAKETKESLESYGLTSSGASASWQKAQSVIPSLTMQEFASTFKAMDTNKKGSISQDEIIAYLNKGSYSQSEGKQYWNAYGNKDWKSVLVLENGKWKKEKK